jgi:hypothetical protein
MSTTTLGVSAASAPAPRAKKRSTRSVGGTHLGRAASAEAKRLATAILEVLAGVRTTADAASAVGLSLTRYYQVESRALAGLLQACEPRAHRRQPSAEREVLALRRQQAGLQRDLARQQALVRLAQRSVGLAAATPPPTSKVNGNKPRRRRPVARALQVAARLHAAAPTVPQPEGSLQQHAE